MVPLTRIHIDCNSAYKIAETMIAVWRNFLVWLDLAIKHFREALRIKPDHALARKNLERAITEAGSQ